MKKKITIGVSDFALPAPRKGSIDVHSGFGRGQFTGLEIHQTIQQQRAKDYSSYQAEVWTSHQFFVQGYTLEVNGRMDGVFNKPKFRIEEIKTSFNIYELLRYLKEAPDDHPYCLQLKTYGYFHWLKTKEIPELNLHLFSTRNNETLDFELELNIENYKKWLAVRFSELLEEIKLSEKRIARRKKTAKTFSFPFKTARPGQDELIKTIEEGMDKNQPMLIQAPTGLGKTMAVLYSTLKEALERGQKVIYLTPKNSQHAVAEDAVIKLQESGAHIKSMTLTAKTKICFKDEPICNSEYCEFAKNHYTKIAANKLHDKLLRKKNLTANVFKAMGREYQVCPFELQFDAIKNMETVICDYNYVFAPSAALGQLANKGIGETGKPNLIIDEAHNLPARGMDYYSPALTISIFEKMLEELDSIIPKFCKATEELLNECIWVIKNCGPANCKVPCKIELPVAAFMRQDDKLRDFLSTYLNSDVIIETDDLVMKLVYCWTEFTAALEFVNANPEEFFTTFSPNPATVKITCCDAAKMLQDCYDDYAQVVGFSATLKPFEFYSQLTGLKIKALKTAEFVSPFPKSNRKILIIPQISSKYSTRQRNYPRIAKVIQKITALRTGNYFAFFPSFEFLHRVAEIFNPAPGFKVLRQERGMSKEAINHVLDQLSDEAAAHIVFAVQGGVFAEGVDYPGNMTIGAFVIGPPLPNFDLERETMKQYYHKYYAAGFDYAYTYPAMAKAVQAAGRVIRSESDKGIIVLMDDRFIQSNYANCMPQDWFKESPDELVSNSILSEIKQFWA